MSAIETSVRKLMHHLGNVPRNIKAYYLRYCGVQIGKNTMVSMGAKIDSHRGKVVIGDNCHITWGAVILSHDGAMKQIQGDDDGDGEVVIGNNVFVGVNAVILRNVHIGDNSIVGAGAVVNSSVPENVIVAGNPAKIVKKINLENS